MDLQRVIAQVDPQHQLLQRAFAYWSLAAIATTVSAAASWLLR